MLHLVGISIQYWIMMHGTVSLKKYIYVTLKDRKRPLSRKNDHNALWHYRSSYNAKLHVAAVLKQPQRLAAWEKQPQCNMSFKWTVYTFRNLLIRNTCNVGLMKNNGEAHLFLHELSEWHLELHFIFFKRHLHFPSMRYLLQWQLTNPCLLPDVIIEADRIDSELEGTSCASMKLLSAAVNSLRAYNCSSGPSLVPNR